MKRNGIAGLRRARGFTLLEASLSVFAMGLILTAMMVAHNQGSQSQGDVADTAFMDKVLTQLFKFATRNNRLPCPDVNGDGFEDATAGVCTADIKSGGVPYATLGIPLSSPVGTGLDRQFVYGVFRGAGNTATDLTLAAKRSAPSAIGGAADSYSNLNDFKQAVINASGLATATNEVYVTGNDASSGAADCSGNVVGNMAFVLAYAGTRNADEQGSDFDGAHLSQMGWSSSTHWTSVKANTCYVGPGKAASMSYDDQVRAVSFVELLGVLNR